MLDRLKAKASEKYLFKVTEAEVAIRPVPELSAPQVGALEYGQVVLLCDLQQDGWARLHDDEVWASGLTAHDAGVAQGRGHSLYVLADGKAHGLPKALVCEHAPVEDWEYAEAVNCAEANGVSWRRPPGGLRPKPLLDLAWLSPWHSPDGTLLEAPPLIHEIREGDRLPRLCVASLVRGAKPHVLESLILHHHSAGFEQVMLYFDKPDDPMEMEAIAAVKRFEQPSPTGPGGLMCTACAISCTAEWWQEIREASRFYRRQDESELFKDVVMLDLCIKDVQSRQALAIDHALYEARHAGFEWLLHVDSDEVLFCPDDERHADARQFFHEVPVCFTAVRFGNLEAVPETSEVDDPFEEVSLFKMNPMLLAELGVEPRILACGDIAPEDEEEEEDLFSMRHAFSVPGMRRNAYERIPRKERHALRRLLAVQHDIAQKRSPALHKLKVTLPSQHWPKKEDDDDDFTDDESCYGPRPDVPAFFNSYSNGKAAVRIHIGPTGEPPPLPAGVHGFMRDSGQSLYELLCKGPGAPVILHYANCGFKDWQKKYNIICTGHGTSDGAFSTKREGIESVRSHIAARELTLRKNANQSKQFYETFVMGNEFDEMAYMAQFGLALRLEAPRRRLNAARRRREEALADGTLEVQQAEQTDQLESAAEEPSDEEGEASEEVEAAAQPEAVPEVADPAGSSHMEELS